MLYLNGVKTYQSSGYKPFPKPPSFLSLGFHLLHIQLNAQSITALWHCNLDLVDGATHIPNSDLDNLRTRISTYRLQDFGKEISQSIRKHHIFTPIPIYAAVPTGSWRLSQGRDRFILLATAIVRAAADRHSGENWNDDGSILAVRADLTLHSLYSCDELDSPQELSSSV